MVVQIQVVVLSARGWQRMVERHNEQIPDQGVGVSRGKPREYFCEVVSESVQIRLKRSSGFGRPAGYFVQCNQVDCQYVDENKPPCPLTSAMFADEIKAAEEARAQRSE